MKCPLCGETHIPEEHVYGFPIVACPRMSEGRAIFFDGDNRVVGVLIAEDALSGDDRPSESARDFRA